MTKKASHFPSRIGFIIFILLVFLLGYFLRTPTPEVEILPEQESIQTNDFQYGTYRVVRVLDGDTIEVEGAVRVRYAGIDAPEKNEAYGLSSAKLNKELVSGQEVSVIPTAETRDPYGRVVADVYVGDVFVNRKLVEAGFARVIVVRGRQRPPHYEELKAAENYARSQQLGIWRKE